MSPTSAQDGAASASGAVRPSFPHGDRPGGGLHRGGGGRITSRLLGKGWKEPRDQYASSAVILGLVLGLLLMSVCFVSIDELVMLLGATPTIYPYALDYTRSVVTSVPR